jgi:hypothetical protein
MQYTFYLIWIFQSPKDGKIEADPLGVPTRYGVRPILVVLGAASYGSLRFLAPYTMKRLLDIEHLDKACGAYLLCSHVHVSSQWPSYHRFGKTIQTIYVRQW